MLTDNQLQLRGLAGKLNVAVPVPKNTAPELGYEGRWVVFHVGRTIYAYNTNKPGKRPSVLTVAGGPVNGLSIEERSWPGKGYRVAWIEQRGVQQRERP